MRSAAICWVLLGVGALTAQKPSLPIVRHIRVKLVSTNREPLNAIGFDAIAAALKSKGIHLAVESTFRSCGGRQGRGYDPGYVR